MILSCAYLYGLPSLHLKPREIAALTRRENEFTAAQVAQYPTRLVGFLSVNPLQDSAIEEIRSWQGSRQLIGLKLHFTASAVDMRNTAERRQLAKVIAVAAAETIPIVIHLGGGKFNADDAELFIRDVLPSARESWVQVAHAGGGWSPESGNNLAVLRAFADHIVRGDRPRGMSCSILPMCRRRTRPRKPPLFWQSKCGESAWGASSLGPISMS